MRRIRKILGFYYYRMIHLYLRLRFWYPVWFYLLNREGHSAFLRENFRLSSIEKSIVNGLQKDGIATVHISELFPEETWQKLLRYANTLSSRPQILKAIAKKEAEPPATKSDIIIHILGGYGDTHPSLDVRDPFIQFAMSNTIVRTIATYLKVLPKFTMFSLHSTILLAPSAPTFFSQNWHRDPDDMKIVKVFLYLSDVSSKKAGPFMYVRGSQFGGKWRHIFGQEPPMGSYPPAEALEAKVSQKDIKICTGRAGSLIFCDTSGLHRGGHSVGKRRIMFAGTYITQAGLRDHKRNFKIKLKKAAWDSLSNIARYSLS